MPPGKIVDEDVLGDAQVREQVEFLVNEGDMGMVGICRCAWHVWLTVQRHRSCIWRHYPANDVHQRAFTRPILPDQAKDMASWYAQANITQRVDPEKSFADLMQFE